MTKRYSKSETPSLGKGQEWTPKSGPSPFREHIGSGAAWPPLRSMAERALKYFDSSANAWRIRKGAKKAPKAPR
jgi:hypothetical protein